MQKQTKSSLIALVSIMLAISTGPLYAHGDHGHKHDHADESGASTEQQMTHTIFEDKAVQERQLSDWNGTWQSLNPYLLSGELDPFLRQKAADNKDMDVEDYRNYYKKGYQSDIMLIHINDDQIQFTSPTTVTSCDYTSSGYEILTYESGNKGVRYLFECSDEDSDAPRYIQFSDHMIAPYQSSHFHIFMGDQSHQDLLREMDNWPTFYPASMTATRLREEMMHH